MTHQDHIRQHIETLLELIGIEGSVAIEDRDGQLVFNIKTSDSRMLIGQYGAHLRAFQHITRLLVRRASEDMQAENFPEFYVDIEDYRRNRDEFLKALARQAAERVRETKETLFLKPMHSYERRVIHSEISKLDYVVSLSEGQEPERRVVIRPKA
jgi:spoIIIJ-associated protein